VKRLLIICVATFLLIAMSVYSEEGNVSQMQDYLPLCTGNSWTYIHVEEPGRIIRNWAEVVLKGGLIYSVRGRKPSSGSTKTEVYTVGDSITLDQIRFWNIEIKNSASDARDGRYHHIPEPPRLLLWGKRLLDDGSLLSIVEERIVRYSTMTSIPSEAEHRAELLIAPERQGIRVIAGRGIAEMICLPNRITINTPAGEFTNCITMVTRVEPEEGSSDDDVESGWESYSYYAPGVGLVKEVQKDLDDNVNYTLELKSYNITGPNGKQDDSHLVSRIYAIPTNSLSAMEAHEVAGPMAEEWRSGAVLVDLMTDRGAYPIPVGTPLPDGRIASERMIIVADLTKPGELAYSVEIQRPPHIDRFVNTFRWRCIYKHQDDYLNILVSKQFIQSEEGKQVPDSGEVQIKDWRIDTDRAISISEQNEATPRGYLFRLKTWRHNNKLIPFWTVPYVLPDHKLFVINATTGQMVIGTETENIKSPFPEE